MVDLKDSVNLMLIQNKLDIKVFEEVAKSNKPQLLCQLVLILSRLIGPQSQKQIHTKNNISNLISETLSRPVEHPQTINKELLLKRLTQEEIISFIIVLQLIRQKLQGTKYSWIIKLTIGEIVNQIKSMPGFNRILKTKQLVHLFSQKSTDIYKQQTLVQLVKSNTFFQKMDSFLSTFTSHNQIYQFLQLKILPLLTQTLISIRSKNKIGYLIECCKMLQSFIPPLEFQIEVQKNALSQSRRFKAPFQREFLLSQIKIIQLSSKILNEMILCPGEIQLQLQLFILLRRMYYLWSEPVKNPILVVISNIVLYSKLQTDLKQVSIFCYRILQEKKDLYLSIQIQNSQSWKFLKESPYFSSKAFAFLDQSHCNFATSNLRLPFFKTLKNIDSGSVYIHTVLIQKLGTLLCWQFLIKSYDIRFGLFKVQNLERLQLSDYEAEKNCKCLSKLNKFTANKHGEHGSTLIKPGVYRLVFDNTYSYLRSKQLIYSVTILQPL